MRPPVLERVFGALCLTALAGSCGGSPASPSAGPPGSPVVLAAGAYALALGSGGGVDTRTPLLCMTVGSGGPGSVVVDVRVEAADGGWLVRAVEGTLTMRLAPSGRHLVGTARGTAYQSPGVGASVGSSDGIDAQVVGEAIEPNTIRGSIDTVSFFSVGGSYSCSDNTWTLTHR